MKMILEAIKLAKPNEKKSGHGQISLNRLIIPDNQGKDHVYVELVILEDGEKVATALVKLNELEKAMRVV